MHNESDKSWNNRRADLISMFKYCEKKNLLPPGALNYGAVARMKVGPGSRATCSLDELQRLLDYAEYLQDQVCVALQAHAGLRTAEVGRFRLRFVDWEELMIRLPGFYLGKRVTKTGEARDIPLVPALHTVLLRLKQKGYPENDLVIRVLNWTDRIKIIANAAGVKMPHNGLRHGFGSHRRQLTKSVDQTAEDMGTSSWYVKNHYSLPQLSRVSKAWFATRAPLLP